MESAKEISIYVHIPFCVRKCNYCDFLSFNVGKELTEKYFEALKNETLLEAEALLGKKEAVVCNVPGDSGHIVRSIFFGGGTPSFVDADKICDVLKAIRSSFAVAKDAEISIEVNPASAMYEKLTAYRRAGFNRISIGAQSLNDRELAVLGRAHDSAMFYETFENARRAGFDNINVDVMSALPGQSLLSYRSTLEKVALLSPEHISAYSLIIEEGTPFYDMELDLPDEDLDREMYHETKRLLGEAGYHRYEISNYALEGRECYHNKVYWRRGNYLGLGLGASSMVDNVRWSNTRKLDRYVEILCGKGREAMEGLNGLHVDVEPLSAKAQMEEFMFLGLRLVEGVDVAKFRQEFGQDLWQVYGEVIDKYVGMGLLEYARGTGPTALLPGIEDGSSEGTAAFLRLTDTGMDVSNTVMAEFLL